MVSILKWDLTSQMLKEKDILLKQVRYEKVLEKLSQIVPGKILIL